jgi:hypothetical protein
MPCEFHDTSHVEKRARERGFTAEQAMLIINDPGSILKTPTAPRQSWRNALVVLSCVRG